jgi:hypothetical protein
MPGGVDEVGLSLVVLSLVFVWLLLEPIFGIDRKAGRSIALGCQPSRSRPRRLPGP